MLTSAIKSKKNSLSSPREFMIVKLPKLKRRCPIVVSSEPPRKTSKVAKAPKEHAVVKMGTDEVDTERDTEKKEEKREDVVKKEEVSEKEEEDQQNYNSGEIRCPCGVNKDIGTFVECESCLTWQHLHCINVGREEDVPNNYKCAFCLFPKKMVRKSLMQPISWYQFLLSSNKQCHSTTQDSIVKQSSLSELESSDRVGVDNVNSNSTSINGNHNNHNSNSNGDSNQNSTSQERDDYATVLKQSVHKISEISNEAKEIQRVIHSIQAKVSLLTVERKDPELKLWQYSWLNDKTTADSDVDLVSTDWKRCRQNLREHVYCIYGLVEYRLGVLETSLELIEANQQLHDLDTEGLHILPALKSTLRSLIVTMTNVKNSIMLTSKES